MLKSDLKEGHIYLCRLSGRPVMVYGVKREVRETFDGEVESFSIHAEAWNPVLGKYEFVIVSDGLLQEIR